MTESAPPDVTTLSNVEQLAWRSLRTLILVGLPRLDRSLRRHGLVQVEYQTLRELTRSPGGVRLGDLATILHVSPSRLSHRIAKLSGRGLVRLRRLDEDGRGVLATVTPAGSGVAEELAADHDHEVRRLLFQPLQPQQVRALSDALSTIALALTSGAGATSAEPEPAPAEDGAPEPARRRWRDALRGRRA